MTAPSRADAPAAAPAAPVAASRALDGGPPSTRRVVGLAVCYLAAALLSLAAGRQPGNVATIWFANAVAVAVLAQHAPRQWTRLVLAVAGALLAANLAWGDRLEIALSFLPANLVEIALSAWAIRRAGLAVDAEHSLMPFGRLLLLAAVLPQALGASLGALTLAGHGMAPMEEVWLPWFEGSVIGAVSVLPLALPLAAHGWRALAPELLHARVLALLPVAVGGALLALEHLRYPFIFALMPLLLAALWLPRAGLSLVTLATSLTIAVALATDVFVMPPLRHAWEQVFVYLAYAATLVPAQLLGAALSELRRSHAELETQALALRRSNDGLEQFVRIASHDLREPMNTVVQFGTLLSEDEAARLPPSSQRYLRFMVGAGQRMRSILDGMLQFVRLQRSSPPEMGPVALDEVLADVRDTVAGRVAERSARLQIEPLPRVRGNAMLLSLALQNLVANALKFVPPERLPAVTVSASVADGMAQVVVADNGIGIAAADLPKLFRPFQRLNLPRDFEGSGLGLALVRQVAEMHGGRVEIESEPGLGSRFTLHLPLA